MSFLTATVLVLSARFGTEQHFLVLKILSSFYLSRRYCLVARGGKRKKTNDENKLLDN